MKYFLSICAIVKNEAPYISEWIQFHRLQGVEKFFIYHNAETGEDTDTYEALKALSPKIDIDYYPWPGKARQMPAYNHCLQGKGQNSEWVAFIDVDEFLWCPYEEQIVTFFRGCSFLHPHIAGLAVPWTLFGSGGQREKSDGLVIERFTTRASLQDKHVKSIVRPKFIQSVGKDPHTFYTRDAEHFIIDERGARMPKDYALHGGGSADIIRCNHYHTKSYGEYVERRRKPDAGSGREATPEWVETKFKAHDVNEIRDFLVRDRYAQRVRTALSGNTSS